MLSNILRTSRCLARKEINSLAYIASSRIPNLCSRKPSSNLPAVRRHYCATSNPQTQSADHVDPVVFDQICNETLESLCEFFEELIEQSPNFKGADVTYSDGVLTVDLGKHYGTYVINRQTPNKQIWLSSPTSGPKRYDLVLKNGGHWVYKHDGMTLHQLLQNEISQLAENKIDFTKLSHGSA